MHVKATTSGTQDKKVAGRDAKNEQNQRGTEIDIRQLIPEFKAQINYLTSVNLPRELLISKIQRDAREKGEKDSVPRMRWGGAAWSQRCAGKQRDAERREGERQGEREK